MRAQPAEKKKNASSPHDSREEQQRQLQELEEQLSDPVPPEPDAGAGENPNSSITVLPPGSLQLQPL